MGCQATYIQQSVGVYVFAQWYHGALGYHVGHLPFRAHLLRIRWHGLLIEKMDKPTGEIGQEVLRTNIYLHTEAAAARSW